MDPIKEAFSKVKEDMQSLRQAIESLKQELLARSNKELALEAEITALNAKLAQTPQNQEKGFFLSSTGNKGVFRQTLDRQTTETRQTLDTSLLEDTFFTLTDKEFLVFLTLYRLEEAQRAPISYTELANNLRISQSSIRDHISELIRKKAPLIKVKLNNKKVLLSVDNQFRTLNLMSKLLNSRYFQDTQTTLNPL